MYTFIHLVVSIEETVRYIKILFQIESYGRSKNGEIPVASNIPSIFGS